MRPNLPYTITWGTASTAVLSAALLASVGCIVPVAQRDADAAKSLRAATGAGSLGTAANATTLRRAGERGSVLQR